MPATSTSRHPSGITIFFDEETHRYWDSLGRSYRSVTTLLKSLFPGFDAAGVSKRIAARDGRDAAEIRAEWKAKGDAACRMGTRVHENIEDRLCGKELRHPEPETEREREAMAAGWQAAGDVLAGGVLSVHPEAVVACPVAGVAGTIDLLAVFPGNRWAICDWKTNSEITWSSKYGKKALPPFSHLDDCDAVRYALQLGIYRWILCHENYVPCGATIETQLCHLAPGCTEPAWFSTFDLSADVERIMRGEIEKAEKMRAEVAGMFAERLAGEVLGEPGAQDDGLLVTSDTVIRVDELSTTEPEKEATPPVAV